MPQKQNKLTVMYSDNLKKVYKLFFAIQIICFLYIFFLAATSAYQNNDWVAPISLGIVLSAIYIEHQMGYIRQVLFKICGSVSEKCFVILLFIAFAVMLLFSILLRVNLSWDYGQIIVSAYEWAKNGEIQNIAYYARYSNNQLMLWLMAHYFKFVLYFFPAGSIEFCKAATYPVNCFFIVLSMYITYQTAKLCFDKKKAIAVGLACLTCSPLYLYSTFAYTDTLGLLPLGCIFYFYLQFKMTNASKRWIWLSLCFLISCFGFCLKATIGIALVAIVIDFFVTYLKFQKAYFYVCVIFLLLLCCVCYGGYSAISESLSSFTNITAEEYDAYKFPSTHWIMMALNKTGGYIQDDVNYTCGYTTFEEKKAANISVIKERLRERDVLGTFNHIIYTKWQRTWAYSTCAADDYIRRDPTEQTFLHEIFLPKGKWYCIYALYATCWWLVLLLGIVLSAVKGLKNKSKLFVFHLTIFGILLFLSFWECNSRYLVLFLPTMILLSIDGLVAENFYQDRNNV